MLKVFIVDDEAPALDLLELLLGETQQVDVLARFDRAKPVLMAVLAMRPDAVFLDIEMPGINGLELAAQLNSASPETEIVFVTAYDRYALEAFRVNAVDYLLKPLSPQSVSETVERLLTRCRTAHNPHLRADGGTAIYQEAYIRCFGSFDVYANASCQTPLVKWRTAKSRELFACLFAQQGRTLPKWSLGEMLWPEMDEQRMTAYLHTTLYQTKKALRAAFLSVEIVYTGGGYQLRSHEALQSDVESFVRLAEGDKPVGEADVPRLEQAISLYQGEYMGDQGYVWALAHAEFYKELLTSACRRLSAFYQEAGQSGRAVLLLQKALMLSPLNEALHQMLLEAYIRQGDRTAYISHFRRYAALLEEELGVAPQEELSRQFNQYLSGK